MATIDGFRGEWAWLSNFAPCRLKLGGQYYASVEHAYQAAKSLDETYRRSVRDAASPGLAKKLGRKAVLRSDWHEIRLQVMEACLRQKFMHPGYRDLLIMTGDRELIEGNYWGDTYWGMTKQSNGEWYGENHLGKLLMKIRAEIRTHKPGHIAAIVASDPHFHALQPAEG